MGIWVTDGGERKRCLRHDVVFGKLESCPLCITDPGPALQVEQRDEPVDLAAIADETWCRERRDELTVVAVAMAKAKRRNPAALARVFDTALKFHRAAVEERRVRGGREHDMYLVRECRELARRGVAN